MQVTTIKADIGINEPFRIFFWGDVQAGSANVDREALARWCKIVADSKKQYRHTYCVTMGDMCDFIGHHDKKRFTAGEIDPELKIKDLADLPRAELDLLDSMAGAIMPLSLVHVEGNHEESVKKYHAQDIHKLMVERYPAPDGITYQSGQRSLGYKGFLRISFSLNGQTSTSVDIALNHGVGGGGYLPGYPTNKASQISQYVRADYSIMGHIHKMVTHQIKAEGLDVAGRYYCDQVQWVGSTGCFQRTSKDGQSGYFERNGRTAVDIGGLMAEIRIIRPRVDGVRHLVRDMRLVKIDLDHPEWKYGRGA